MRTNIIELHLKPAEQLSENVIADLLGVSRTPVREAFIRLAEDNLLVIMPQKKTVVSLIDLEQAEEARFVRRALEKAVIREICGRLVDKDREEFDHNIDIQKECMGTGAFDRFLLVDNDFHRMIFRACGKERSWAYIKKLDYNYDRLRIMTFPHVKDQVIAEHKMLLQILFNGSTALVDDTVDRHLTNAVIERVVDEYPASYFFLRDRKPAACMALEGE